MTEIQHGLLESTEEFLRNRYKEAIAQLVQSETEGLEIDHSDLYKFDPKIADAFIQSPERFLYHLQEAVDMVEIPYETDLSDVEIRVVNLPETHIYHPAELRHEHAGMYVGVEGTLSRTTGTVDRPEMLVFECDSGHEISVPQEGTEIQEPGRCPKCERKPTWRIKEECGEWTDECKIKVETPPDESGAIDGGNLPGYVRGSLVDYGHEIGLAGRTGETVRAYGIVRRQQRTGRNKSGLAFDRYLDVKAIEFLDDTTEIAIEEHRDAFERLANEDDPVTLWMESLAPELYATPEWERALELGVAYLFAAPRIDIDGGPTYRGDIHMLIVSDYGMGKSTFTDGIAEYSPQVIKKSATGLGSGVGLTAAAVKDDEFGDGGWILKPGILVRGNGGHVILDEIDKGPDSLTEMNDALEGQQVVSIEKAGKDAEFNSRVGLLATGNPVDGKFDPQGTIANQIGIDASLLSRFDGIVTMRDEPDEEIDEAVANTAGTAYKEAQELAHGERETMDVLERPVPTDVGRAWVQYARENIHPLVTTEHIEELRTWYAEDVREINNKIGEDDSGEEPPVPITARVVENTLRIAVAFARVKLQEKVTEADIERAKDLIKTLAGQTFGEDGYIRDIHAREFTTNMSQDDRVDLITSAIEREKKTAEEIADETGIKLSMIEKTIENLKQKGAVYEPEGGYYLTT